MCNSLALVLSFCHFMWQTSTQTLHSLGVDRGEWSIEEKCPPGSFVTGMRLKLEDFQGRHGDDTALNGIRFFCATPWMTNLTRIESEVGAFGEWKSEIYCPAFTFAFGMELKSEKHVSSHDQVGAVNLRLYCGSQGQSREKVVLEGEGVRGKENDWGEWDGPAKCPFDSYICSLQTQVEPILSENKDGEIDDSSVNNIRVTCCPIHPTE